MATGTLAPSPWFTALDSSGVTISGALITTYVAGTSTLATTYSDVGLTTPNANPVVCDSAGRCVMFLTPGSSYKFLYQNAAGVTQRTQDNIPAVPAGAGNVDVPGTVGEAITAGQVVYLSDGSGGKTQGQWYLADADFTYASTTAMVGIAPSAISSGISGTIRREGQVTGLSGLTSGAPYYISATAGALTATAPPNSRLLGYADSTSSLVLGDPPLNLTQDIGIVEGRLTATTALPVTVADVSGATSIYFTPYRGNRIALFDGTATWNIRTFTEITISLAAFTASKPYDIFAYDNAGVVTIETLIWTNTTTRATALTTQNGVLVKTGATTRRYLGTVYINASGGQTDDTLAKRYLYNYYNKVQRPVRRLETAANWAYTLAAYHQANASAANQIEIMNGWIEDGITLAVIAAAQNSSAGVKMAVSIGENSTTASATGAQQLYLHQPVSNEWQPNMAALSTIPAVGYSYYAWLEYSEASGTTTWQGVTTPGASGISGMWRN